MVKVEQAANEFKLNYSPNSHGFRVAVLKQARENMIEFNTSAQDEAELIQKKYGFTHRTVLSYRLALDMLT